MSRLRTGDSPKVCGQAFPEGCASGSSEWSRPRRRLCGRVVRSSSLPRRFLPSVQLYAPYLGTESRAARSFFSEIAVFLSVISLLYRLSCMRKNDFASGRSRFDGERTCGPARSGRRGDRLLSGCGSSGERPLRYSGASGRIGATKCAHKEIRRASASISPWSEMGERCRLAAIFRARARQGGRL